MKKVFIVTYFTWRNYGAVLQATALNQYLIQMGYDAQLIDYRLQDAKAKIFLSWKSKLRHKVLDLLEKKRRRQTEKFLWKNIKFTKPYKKMVQLKEIDCSENCFIAGSDQVWNPNLCNNYFFLDFVHQGRKLSYAASMGQSTIPAENESIIKDYLKGMSALSVREKDAQITLQNLLNRDIEVHIDPTMLLPLEFWKRMESPYPIGKPYVLVYPLYWDQKYNLLLKRIHQEEGLEIVAVGINPNVFCTKRIIDADPGQFLFLIHHADRVVTSSYHGTIFSLLYHKKVGLVVNPVHPTRIDNMLEKFDMILLKETWFSDWDVSDFEDKLVQERERSKQYLKEILGDPND